MNIVFIGATRFGLLCLEKILNLDCCQVVGVVTAPQTFSISYRPEGVTNVLYAKFGDYCEDKNIRYLVIKDGMKDVGLFKRVSDWQPDLFVVVGWYHLIPKKWRNLAPVYGLHASLLPDYSGGAPLVWALINDEKKTGITFFQFDDGVDSGPIIGQAETPILKNDTIASLYVRIEQLGLDLLVRYMPDLVNNKVILCPQEEHKRRVFPQRSPEDGLIDWHKSSWETFNFIRAQTKPYPGAFTWHEGKKLTIWDSEPLADLINIDSVQAGQVLSSSSKFIVKCGSGALKINRLTDSEIGEIDGKDYRAYYITEGSILGLHEFSL